MLHNDYINSILYNLHNESGLIATWLKVIMLGIMIAHLYQTIL